jgi:hypothetical protein
MALRKVFSQDSDFQEKMFAKQIAVMKGQAWNVVETLKTTDHGPLELTRRARVYVWDDLVDVPVAIPMRVPSAEMRRRRDPDVRRSFEEEMDIGTANASAPTPQHDLLGLSSPIADLPNPKRFNLARNDNSSDENGADIPETTAPTKGVTRESESHARESKRLHTNGLSRSDVPHTKTRLSFEEHRPAQGSLSHRRRYSFSARHGSTAFFGDGDDLEGDLGYAAAEGMEGNQRKVIVERLETVKSKNPVFTWC